MSAEEHRESAAGRLLHWNGLVNSHEGWQQTNAVEALVEATLYAAEQQRVANLIAYAAGAEASGYQVNPKILDAIHRALA